MRYLAGLQEEQVEPQAAAQGVSGALGLFAGEATLARIITLVPKD
ncbi:MAG: hypothetical protein WD766_14090 [Gemmatimonadota bacterium]